MFLTIDCNDIDNKNYQTTLHAEYAEYMFAQIVSRDACRTDSKGRGTGYKRYT